MDFCEIPVEVAKSQLLPLLDPLTLSRFAQTAKIFSKLCKGEFASRVPEKTRHYLQQTQASTSCILSNMLSISGEYISEGYYCSGVCTLGLLQTDPSDPSRGVFLIRKDDYHRLGSGTNGKICSVRGWFKPAPEAKPLSAAEIYIPADTLELYRDVTESRWEGALPEASPATQLVATIQFHVLNVGSITNVLLLRFTPHSSELEPAKMMCRLLSSAPREGPSPWNDAIWDDIESRWTPEFKEALSRLEQTTEAFSSNLRSAPPERSLQSLFLFLTYMYSDIMDCETFETFSRDGFDVTFAANCREFLEDLEDAEDFDFNCQSRIMEEWNYYLPEPLTVAWRDDIWKYLRELRNCFEVQVKRMDSD